MRRLEHDTRQPSHFGLIVGSSSTYLPTYTLRNGTNCFAHSLLIVIGLFNLYWFVLYIRVSLLGCFFLVSVPVFDVLFVCFSYLDFYLCVFCLGNCIFFISFFDCEVYNHGFVFLFYAVYFFTSISVDFIFWVLYSFIIWLFIVCLLLCMIWFDLWFFLIFLVSCLDDLVIYVIECFQS